MPPGTMHSLEAEIPEPPHFEGARFASVEDALRDGPKFFEQLMTAVGSEDGREIVLELEDLRSAGRLERDASDGRYRLTK